MQIQEQRKMTNDMNKFFLVPSMLFSTVCALGVMTSISNAQLPGTLSDGLVAYYSFNGNANDSVGNLDGEVHGGVTTSSDRFGNPNSAYMFNGSNGVIGPASPLTYPFALVSNSFTVSVWFQANQDDTLYPQSTDPTIRGHNFIVSPYWGGYGNGAGIGISAGLNGISLTEQADRYFPTVLTFESSIGSGWVNAVFTVSNNQAPILFVNGNLAATGVYTGRDLSFAPFQDTGNGVGGGGYGYFNGGIDDLAIWNTALSSTQVSDLYAAQSVPEPSTYALLLLSGAASLWALRRRKS